MKKFLLGLLLLISSFFMMPSSVGVSADSTSPHLNISTIYPLGVEGYQDLTDVKQVTASDKYIAFTSSNISINVYNKQSKQTISIGGFENIYDIKFVRYDQLIVIDYSPVSQTGTFKYIDLKMTEPTPSTFETINLSGLKLVDIYESNSTVYFGMIRETTSTDCKFELYTISNPNKLTTPSFHHEVNNSFYNTANNLTISNSHQYVTNSENKLIVCEYNSNPNITQFSINSSFKILKFITINNTSYLLAFTNETMYILPHEQYTLANNNYKSNQDMKLSAFTDVDICGNLIYICDSSTKTIRNYALTLTQNNDNSLIIQEIENHLWLASNDSALGRFNNASDIYIQGKKFVVADSDNNRIQIIENGKESTSISNGITTGSNPHGVLLDRNQNMYIIVDNTASNTSSVLKYALSNETYNLVQTYSSFNNGTLGSVSSSTIDTNNNIYLVDYQNNNLVILSQAGLQVKCNFSELTHSFTTSSTTKIEYIITHNCLAILNNNIIYLLDISDIENIVSISQINVSDCQDISCDLDNIYALGMNTIKKITIDRSSTPTMQISQKSLSNTQFSQISTFTCDPTNGNIVAFKEDTQSIVTFSCNIIEPQYNIPDFTTSIALSKSNIPLAINIASGGIIYDYPYYKGNYYLNKISCIGIDFDGEFYRILFEENQTLHSGYIHKDYVPEDNIKDFNTTNKTKVITTDQQVPVYKYPTLLKVNNIAVITQMLPTQTVLYVSSTPFPVQIDGKQFYLYEKGDSIGFLFNANIVEDNEKHISYLHTENATINAIGENEIHLYAEDKTTIVLTLSNSDRIYVDTYDKNSEYTKVIFKDTDMNTSYEGYIKTKFVEMDKLDDNKIILILIISVSIIILIIITTSYIIIKKRK